MAKALKIGGAILGAIALGVAVVATAGTALLAFPIAASIFGVSAATLGAISAGLMVASSLLAPTPKAPAVSPATTDRLQATIDLRTPRKIVFGRTALATDVRDHEYSNGQDFLNRFIVLASHRIHAVRELWFDDKLAWSAAGGVQGDYAGWLDVTPVTEGSAANAITTSGRMGSSRRYTGLAYLYLRYRLIGPVKKMEGPFAQSIPSRVTVVGDAALVYDPRRDSSVGGSGPQRADDQTTWAWDNDAARNPALQLLWYFLGWRIQNPVTGAWKLAVGKGIPPARIDIASFITAANACDEPVTKAAGGTEPRYRSDGIFSEADPTSLVIDNLKAAMNAVVDDIDGRIVVTVLHNDLATPAGSLSEDDVLGDFQWDQTPDLRETFNVVRGAYTDPSTTSLYQQVDYPEVRIDSPDGIERVETINLPLVQSPSQAQRLAKQRLQRMLYSGIFSATFLHTAWRYQKNDLVLFTFRPLGWVNRPMRVIDGTTRVDGTVPLVLRVEHVDIYAWDADEAPAVQGVAPTTYNQQLSPIAQAFVAIELGAGAQVFAQADEPTGARLNDLWFRPNGQVFIYLGDGNPEELLFDGELLVFDGETLAFGGGGGWVLSTLSEAVFSAGGNLYFLDDDAPVATKIGDSWFNPVSGVLSRWNGAAWVPTADRTAQNQHTFPQVPSFAAATDYQGVATSGLPADRSLRRYLGQADVSAATDYSISNPGTATATIDNTPSADARGTLTLTAAPTETTITVKSSYGGVDLYMDVPVTVSRGTPPSTGGGTGAGGGAGGAPGPSASSSGPFASPGTATAYVVLTALAPVTVGSSGIVSLSTALTFSQQISGGTIGDETEETDYIERTGLSLKWQRSVNDGGWSDVAAFESGKPATKYFKITVPKGMRDYPGWVSDVRDDAGLSSGAAVAYRLLTVADPPDYGASNISGTITAAPQ